MIDAPSIGLWELLKHARSWLGNLHRAGRTRKLASVTAVREIVIIARETAVYLRQINETGKREHATERRLTAGWTNLGFQLKDLGLTKLAKRCQISGKHWSNPNHFDDEFLRKADVSVERMEKLALDLLNQIDR